MADKRALKILFDTYWSSAGWKGAGNLGWQPQTPPSDLAHAIEKGVMFTPRAMEHDEIIDRVIKTRTRIQPQAVAMAFVASLSTERADLRSALGTYAVARHLPKHKFAANKTNNDGLWCTICGEFNSNQPHDLNVLSFERYKWGGVRHLSPLYIALDLEWFLARDRPEPTPKGREILDAIINAAESLAPRAKLADLVKALTGIVPGNKDQRRALISILGFASVLQPREHPGFFRSFVAHEDREQTPWSKDDWPYPIMWWKGQDGVNHQALKFWFGIE